MDVEGERGEQRRHERYPAKEGGVASLRIGSDVRLGTIVDVSRGGLAFRYIDETSHQGERNVALDILYGQDGFLLEKIPARVVNDFETVNEFSFNLLPVRRCSLSFGELTAQQEEQLEYLLANYTPGVHS